MTQFAYTLTFTVDTERADDPADITNIVGTEVGNAVSRVPGLTDFTINQLVIDEPS